MKRFKTITKTFVCSLIMLLIVSSLCATAFAVEPTSGTYKDFLYNIESSGKITITGYSGEDANVTIPAEINKQKVAYIGSGAFIDNTKIKYVTIPESIVAIDEYAFSGCTALERVMIPRSMETIKSTAFEGCAALDKVFYCGTEYSWDKMEIPMLGNSYLLSAELNFDCNGSENIANNFPVTLFVWIIVGVVGAGLAVGTVTYIRLKKGGKKQDN